MNNNSCPMCHYTPDKHDKSYICPHCKESYAILHKRARMPRVPPEYVRDPKTGDYYDGIEDKPEYQAVIAAVEKELDSRMRQQGITFQNCDLGFCHTYWKWKQDILREQYGIHWATPAQMNPSTCYD